MSCHSSADCAGCRHSGLDCIFAAHDHQTAACDDLKRFCSMPDDWNDRPRAERLLRFLGVNVAAHMTAEDEHLLPLLRRRGLIATEDADGARIAAEHRRERGQLDKVVGQLKLLATGIGRVDAAALLVGGIAFVHNYLRHVDAEDRRLRLYAADLSEADHDLLRQAIGQRLLA